MYSAVRELMENSLDACELQMAPPEVYIRLQEFASSETGSETGTSIYRLRIEDNGTGLPPEHIPRCFSQVFYGSKYTLKQSRGTFGLGGTITILYGQITTHKPVTVISSTGGDIHEFEMMIDIEHNSPIILKHTVTNNKRGWRGTTVELQLEGDYSRIKSKLFDYVKQTAMVTPYASIVFVDPSGRLYRFERVTEKMPPLPKAVKPHPHGMDVENFRRLVSVTKAKNMKEFMMENFQGVGPTTAEKFLKASGTNPNIKPGTLGPDDIVKLARAARDYTDFVRPDPSCLSPIGEELLETGIRKELDLTEEDFLKVVTRKPSTYLGFPFVVEAAIAHGKSVTRQFKSGMTLIRFANRIPLLFDESSGVSWKVVNKNISWNTYKVSPDTPLVIVVHVCSTKIPYKTVGKEYLADEPEVEKEITNAIREAARDLRVYISRSIRMARERRRLDIFGRYLPKIAEFSTKLSERDKTPDIQPLLQAVSATIPDVDTKIKEVSTIAGQDA